MSLIIPDSSVSLYADVPISAGHQLLFKNKNEQKAYFRTKRIATKAGCTYLKKTNKLRIEWPTSQVQKANYITFTNPSFENVVFYAMLIDWDYVNNTTTDVVYAIDYYQTFCFDVKYHACSIIREHLTEADYQKAVTNPWRNDIPELLTDEGLPVGPEYEKIYDSNGINELDSERHYFPSASFLGDIKSDELYLCFEMSQFDITRIQSARMYEFINAIDYYRVNDGMNTINMDLFSDWKDSAQTIEEGPTAEQWRSLFTYGQNNFIATTGHFYIQITEIFELGKDPQFKPSCLAKIRKVMDFLAINSITNVLISTFVLPKWIIDSLNYNGLTALVPVHKDSRVDNPKLNRFPYRYLRVETENNTKEYHYEYFESMLSNNTGKNFSFWASVLGHDTGMPEVDFIPQNYRYFYNQNDDDSDALLLSKTKHKLNLQERIAINQFAQVGVSTDAYLSMLGNVYQKTLASNTTHNAYQRGFSTASSFAALAGGAANNLDMGSTTTRYNYDDMGRYSGTSQSATGGYINPMSVASNVISGMSSLENIGYQQDLINEAFRNKSGENSVFANTQRAYAASEYHPGTTTGLLSYHLNRLRFVLTHVKLNSKIIKEYDNYLKIYGYKSGRFKTPNVCDYITNGTHIPHFSTFDNEKFTYIQTENMHVTGNLQVACSAIEQLFNNGCRFLKVVD